MNLKVVPDGWAARHRPIVSGFFVDTATIERATKREAADGLSMVEVWEPLTPEPIPALVQVNHTTATNDVDSAGRHVVVTAYYGRFDVDWLPLEGDRVTVVTSPDPANIGTYRVARRESQGHVVDRTVHLTRTVGDPHHT